MPVSVRTAGRRLHPCPGTHSSICIFAQRLSQRETARKNSSNTRPYFPFASVVSTLTHALATSEGLSCCRPLLRSVQRPPVVHFPVRVGITYARADLYAAPYGHTQLGMKYPFPATPALRELRSPNLLIPFPGFE